MQFKAITLKASFAYLSLNLQGFALCLWAFPLNAKLTGFVPRGATTNNYKRLKFKVLILRFSLSS